MDMMKIRNPNLAGTDLMLRYTRDDDDRRLMVTGDSNGVFTVPMKDGKFLLKTKGWKAWKPVKELPAADVEPDGSDDEVPDLDKLAKKQLLELAEKYGKDGYDIEVDDTMLKADIKAVIANAIFE